MVFCFSASGSSLMHGCPYTTLKITKSFPNLPVSKLSAGRAHCQWNWALLWDKECCVSGRLFPGLDAVLWHSEELLFALARKIQGEVISTERIPWLPPSSDLLKYRVDVGSQGFLSAVALEDAENFILPSFLTIVFLRDRWSFKGISSPGLNRSFHWKTSQTEERYLKTV